MRKKPLEKGDKFYKHFLYTDLIGKPFLKQQLDSEEEEEDDNENSDENDNGNDTTNNDKNETGYKNNENDNDKISATGDIKELFEKIPTNKTGACLYRAFLCSQKGQQIHEKSLQKQAKDLRKQSMETAKSLIQNPNFRKKYISLPTKEKEKQKILNSIEKELQQFAADDSKWTVNDKSVKFLEDIIPDFIAAHTKKSIVVIKPDNSITRITGFEQANDNEKPILIYLQQDHYSAQLPSNGKQFFYRDQKFG